MSLKKFIEQENRFRTFVNQQLINEAAIDNTVAQELFRKLNSNLSPEVLFADGERPRAKAMALRKVYMQAIADLKAKGFVPEEELYNV